MSITALDSMAVGTLIPTFSLPNVLTGEYVSSAELRASFPKGILIIFLCRHCPYVKHIQAELIHLAHDFMPQGIGFIGICSNDATTYPEDAPASLKEMVEKDQIPFPLLFDESQEVARKFSACCTPDFFLFNSSSRLAYHGRFDGSTPKNKVVLSGDELHSALETLSRGGIPKEPFYPSIGCSIKWKQ